jgi:thiol-disulfide isomerase/thioredoxin
MRRMIAAGPPTKRPPQSRFLGCSAWSGTIGFALLFALSAALAADEDKIKLGEFIPATPPQPAPATAFTDLDGKPASLGDFKGKPAVVNLWATWCQPCLKEMPSLGRLQAQLDGKLVVAAVSEDRGGAKVVAPFVAEKGLQKLGIYLDPNSELGHAIGMRGLPTSLVLNADGKVVGKVEGAAEWDSDKMLAVLKPLLETPADTLKKAAR